MIGIGRAVLVIAAMVGTSVGCASGRGGMPLPGISEAVEAARAWDEGQVDTSDPDALFRAALGFGLPDSPLFEPRRATALFDTLLTRHPDAAHRAHAEQLRQMLAELLRAERRQVDDVIMLSGRVAALQERIDSLEARLGRETSRGDGLRVIADRLDRTVRERDARIRALEDELEALKEIDLGRPPGATGARAPRG
jgi:hypothetical protein